MAENKDFCIICKKELTYEEIIAHKKLISREAEEFLCIDCLARRFEITPQAIRERLEYFRKQGCTLFNGK